MLWVGRRRRQVVGHLEAVAQGEELKLVEVLVDRALQQRLQLVARVCDGSGIDRWQRLRQLLLDGVDTVAAVVVGGVDDVVDERHRREAEMSTLALLRVARDRRRATADAESSALGSQGGSHQGVRGGGGTSERATKRLRDRDRSRSREKRFGGKLRGTARKRAIRSSRALRAISRSQLRPSGLGDRSIGRQRCVCLRAAGAPVPPDPYGQGGRDRWRWRWWRVERERRRGVVAGAGVAARTARAEQRHADLGGALSAFAVSLALLSIAPQRHTEALSLSLFAALRRLASPRSASPPASLLACAPSLLRVRSLHRPPAC